MVSSVRRAPFSVAIWRAALAAARLCACSFTTWRRESASLSTVRYRKGIGSVAAPRAASRFAQNGWSAVTGTGTAATPARSAAADVPAPPWWTTAASRGNSRACGTSPIVSRPSPSTASPAVPAWRMPRCPGAAQGPHGDLGLQRRHRHPGEGRDLPHGVAHPPVLASALTASSLTLGEGQLALGRDVGRAAFTGVSACA